MSVTATKKETIALVLNQADPNEIADALRLVKLGRMLSPVKITLAGLTAASAINLGAIKKGAATVTVNSGLSDLGADDFLPALLALKTLRVSTSGTANSVGTYGISDAGGTPVSPTAGANMGIATLSDDGKTLTFPTTITGLVIEYIPRADADLETAFASI